MQEIEQLMVDKGGQAVSAAAVAQLEEAIVRAMFMLESTANHRDAHNRYQKCVALLSVNTHTQKCVALLAINTHMYDV